MHPHNAHRAHKVEHRRVEHITKGYASGGAVHDDATADLKMLKSHVKRSAMKMDGHKPKHRADRPHRAKGGRVEKERHTKDDLQPFEGAPDDNKRARGGRTKHKGGKTVINIVNAHPGAGAAPPGGAAPPMLPPRPPLPVAAPPAAPPAPPSMMPRPPAAMGAGPMIGPRQDGGRTYAKGGRVKDGPAYQEGLHARPVEHAPGKQDTKNIGRGKVVTYAQGGGIKRARGGAVEHAKMAGGNFAPTKVPHSGGTEAKQGLAQRYGGGDESTHSYAGAHMPGGAKGGEARLYKAHRYAKMG